MAETRTQAEQQLVEMGFELSLAQFALNESNNDVADAVTFIMNSSPKANSKTIAEELELPGYSLLSEPEKNYEKSGISKKELGFAKTGAVSGSGISASATSHFVVPIAPLPEQNLEKHKSKIGKWIGSIGDHSKKINDEELRRWGPIGSQTHNIVMQYWSTTRMANHWINLRQSNQTAYLRYLHDGYCEPIPTAWVYNRKLAMLYPEYYVQSTGFESPGEERLYYVLNHLQPYDSRERHVQIRPLNLSQNPYAAVARGNKRMTLARPIDPELQRLYASPHDVFLSGNVRSHEYSRQVPHKTYEARQQALHALADGIVHGTDHLETMLLVDVSGSMMWDPRTGVRGPDGIFRIHDQLSNIQLVKNLVHRVLNHMVPRAQREHPGVDGIPTVTFATTAAFVGNLTPALFESDWNRKVVHARNFGGSTQVMQGWQTVKATYFEAMHKLGHGYRHPDFGWQATPGMPKLSLLVFLDGEANDMDEFELELMGETWAYVTIALVGYENCPHHHSHAIELERVCKFNPHVEFHDVQGRVLERLLVEDLLKSVYPVDPPDYTEILSPAYEV
ncbi:hypothetical protein HK100_001860 [Physocladia obscura]|uniref:UBA domain-containing protein n=1 Tax=Physocladia obscura TaxID=109957 RepID=A0AAD5SYA3_9FUNG|nr:hypothetical protein HK100_001860 [Physocladia obscura]